MSNTITSFAPLKCYASFSLMVGCSSESLENEVSRTVSGPVAKINT